MQRFWNNYNLKVSGQSNFLRSKKMENDIQEDNWEKLDEHAFTQNFTVHATISPGKVYYIYKRSTMLRLVCINMHTNLPICGLPKSHLLC